MDLLLTSLLLGSIFLVPLLLRTLSPHLWTDLLYLRDLLRVLVLYAGWRRRRPPFFVLDRFLEQCAAFPQKAFIVFGEESFSFSETDRRSNKVSHALQNHARYRPGDPVALFMGNEPAFLFTWLALAKLGSPVALLNSNIRSKSLLHSFSCCGASVLIAAEGSWTPL